MYKLLSVYELKAALDMVHRVLTDDDTDFCALRYLPLHVICCLKCLCNSIVVILLVFNVVA